MKFTTTQKVDTATGGFTIIELLMVVAISVILIAALSLFVGHAFSVSRAQFEQAQITEDARIQLERMSDAIRNAGYVDCDGDGFTAVSGEHWLRLGSPAELIVWSDIDSDEVREQIRYWIEDRGAETFWLHQEIIRSESGAVCNFTSTPVDTVVLKTLRDAVIFRYFSAPLGETGELSAVPSTADASAVRRIRIQLSIDVSDVQAPEQVQLQTDVSPREDVCDSGNCGTLACVDPGFLVEADQIEGQFAESFYDLCIAHCGTNPALPAGECCGWSATFSTAGLGSSDVTGLCECAASEVPDALTAETVAYGNYSTYIRECLDGTTCGGVEGTPHCQPGCLSEAGQCACDCSV